MKYEYLDALSQLKISSTDLRPKLEEFETLNELKLIIPDFEEFDSQTYLLTIHKDTNLHDFSAHVQALKLKLRAGHLNKDLKVELIKENFDTYFQAKRALEYIQSVLEKVQFFKP